MAGSGSLGRIYGSAIKLQPTHFLNNLRKHSLLKPPIPSSSSSSFSSSHPFSLGSGSETTNHYGNPSHLFGSTFTTTRTRYSFNSPIFGVDQVPSFPGFGSPSNGNPSKKVNIEDGFVKDMQQYMVKDDLVSTISIVKLLKRFGVEGVSCLEEKTVFIDSNKALELVRASFASDTVLTDVFVKNLIDV